MKLHNRAPIQDVNPQRKWKRLLTMGLVSLLAFAVGFWIDPVYLRMIWILTSGTLTVVSGIWIYLMVNNFLT